MEKLELIIERYEQDGIDKIGFKFSSTFTIHESIAFLETHSLRLKTQLLNFENQNIALGDVAKNLLESGFDYKSLGKKKD